MNGNALSGKCLGECPHLRLYLRTNSTRVLTILPPFAGPRFIDRIRQQRAMAHIKYIAAITQLANQSFGQAKW